jgi:hypothetical protein
MEIWINPILIWKLLFLLASYGIIGLYFYNKEIKEEKQKKIKI